VKKSLGVMEESGHTTFVGTGDSLKGNKRFVREAAVGVAQRDPKWVLHPLEAYLSEWGAQLKGLTKKRKSSSKKGQGVGTKKGGSAAVAKKRN